MLSSTALEVYGHLDAQVLDAAKLYRAEMLSLAKDLGLTDWRNCDVTGPLAIRSYFR